MTDSPALRLAQLLDEASPEDRHAITAWLLERGSAAPRPRRTVDLVRSLGSAPLRVDSEPPAIGFEPLRGTALPPGEDSQLVTFRLPQERHAQLRDWCAEHNFTMASVIRGLVERFLEQRTADAPVEEPPAD